MRAVFFVGLTGSDDLYYLRFAAFWQRVPANHWEARLLGNALITASMKLFGRTELAGVAPSLAASLAVIGSLLYVCRHFGRWRQALWAGMLIAALPIDIEMATSITPYTVMTGFLAVGTAAFLVAPDSPMGRIVAALALALGVVTHYSGIYYVTALAAGGLIVDCRQFLSAVLLTLIAGVLVLSAELAVFYILYDDALVGLRICEQTNHLTIPDGPVTPEGTIHWYFFYWPVRQLLFSNAFGIALIATILWSMLRYGRMERLGRVLSVTCVLYWVWMCYGSKVPWDYVPFWRMTRFQYPMTLAMAILFGGTVTSPGRRGAVFVGMAVIAVCLFISLCRDTGGENVRVSRELAAYAADRPEQRFITDYHTLNEMWAVQGLVMPHNVVTLDDAHWSQLMDRHAERIPADRAGHYDAILVNPINAARTPHFAAFIERCAGDVIYSATPGVRPIGALLSPLRHWQWSQNKPPARVHGIRMGG